jgi:hypothetical protein
MRPLFRLNRACGHLMRATLPAGSETPAAVHHRMNVDTVEVQLQT